MTRNQKVRQTATFLGIVTQLFANRMNQILGQHDFTLAQFGLLNHLARHAKVKHTVSDLTTAMELNQPAVSKTVQKLAKMGLITIEKDGVDSRKKWIAITETGFSTIEEVVANIGPDMAAMFGEWDEDNLDQFNQYLQQLSHWLDQNRLR